MPITTKISEAIHHRNWKELKGVVPFLEPSELAGLILDLPNGDQAVLFRLLPETVAAQTFSYLDSDRQQSLMAQLGQREVAQLLNGVSPDDRTAFLEELPAPVLQRTLQLLTDEERAVASTLLGYPEHSIGRKMTPYYVAVHPDWTVGQVLTHIRRVGKKSETITHIYVIDSGVSLLTIWALLKFYLLSKRLHRIPDGSSICLSAGN